MAKQKYQMKTERSDKMNSQQMQKLSDMRLAPYMQLATGLIGKARHAGGNMFRHQMDTLAILIDYGYIDSVLLKASIDMLRETHKKSLVEGVETEAHIAVLRELGCDYLQGFYFSKPLPKEQFIALIRSA
jgi:c-di-GMP-related signal transduction protein